MSKKTNYALACLAFLITTMAFGYAIVWWISVPASHDIGRRDPKVHPGLDTAEGGSSAVLVDIEGSFRSGEGTPSLIKSSWPAFRGERFDNINRENVPLADKWGKNGPPVIWSLAVGDGHAAPAVHNGRLYILDHDEKIHADVLRCLSLDDGKEIWRRWYDVRIKRNHGITRTVPAVTDDYVVSIGPKCHVLCATSDEGSFLWGIDLVREFGANVPLWYTGQCPLIDNGVAVLAPGGDSLLVGVECSSGEVLWKTPNPKGWKMSHSSVTRTSLMGRDMYIYCAIGGIVGVAAEGEDRGRILLECAEWNQSVFAPSPVPVDSGKVFLTAGYGAGSMMLRISKDGDSYSAVPEYLLDRKVFGCEQQTPILYSGHLFAVLPNDAGEMKKQLACIDLAGNRIWTSGKEDLFGLGPFLLAGNKMFIMDDEGLLTMAEVSPTGYRRLDRAQILQGRDSWGPLVLAQGRLLARDDKRMVCLDVRAETQK
jgi:outer membrane protein assembly factor BamB